MSHLTPYVYTRWTWGKTYKIIELTEKLKEFTVILMKIIDPDNSNFRLNITDTPILEVKADTLSAYLAPSKVSLFQKESAPFTKRDLDLREILLSLYPHSTSTPIPFPVQKEPEFRVVRSY